MIHIRSTAFPAAVTLALCMGACQDAPSGPRSPSAPIGSASSVVASGIRVFDGSRADSVANEILGAWSVNGHPEYLAQRKLSRAGLHLAPLGVASASLTPGAAPAHILDDGTSSGSTYKDPASVNSHSANFYFGQSSGPTVISTLLSASMTFVGDYGQIDAAVTVTGQGLTVPQNATIAAGGGQLTSCAYSPCAATKFMEGSLVMNNVPTCGAHAGGTVTFTAQNRDLLSGGLPYAPLSSGGSAYLPMVVVTPISTDAPACTTQTGDNTGGTGTPGDGTDGPPTYPAPEPAPPSYPPSGPVDFHCETAQWYNAGSLEWEIQTCYPD